MTNQQVAPEALRCAEWLEHIAAGRDVVDIAHLAATSAAELRRLAALVEAQQPADCGNTPYDEGPFTLAQQPAPSAAVSARHPTVVHWRNDGIEVCAKIADDYGFPGIAQDMRALLTAQPVPSAVAAVGDEQKALKALHYYMTECTGHEPSISVFHRMVEEALAPQPSPTPQADNAQGEPLQAFDSPRAKALMRAWEEGWAACRDAEYVGEEAQNDAFNSSHTLTLCIAEDQQLPAPQADSQPAHQWDIGYPPLPEPDIRRGGFPNLFREDQMRAYVDADRAARAPADSVTAPAGVAVRQALQHAIETMIVESQMRDDLAENRRLKRSIEVLEQLAATPTPPAQAADSVLDAAFEAVRKKLCALPRYSFVLDDDGLVRRVKDRVGNWIEFDEAHALFDPTSVDAARKQGGAQ